ncbi:unnamed protein product, partial [Nesidiocoris tenuis]
LKLRVAFPVHLIVLDPRLSDKEDSYNLIMKNHVPAPIREIAQCLHLLIDKHFILRTGHVRLRFVHNKHKKPWVVRSCFITRLQREKLPSSSATNVSLAFRLTNSDATAKSDAGESSRENPEIAGVSRF